MSIEVSSVVLQLGTTIKKPCGPELQEVSALWLEREVFTNR